MVAVDKFFFKYLRDAMCNDVIPQRVDILNANKYLNVQNFQFLYRNLSDVNDLSRQMFSQIKLT